MTSTLSATQARVRFGEVIRRVSEQDETIIVERGGERRVVILSIREYERLVAARSSNSGMHALERLAMWRDRVHARRRGGPLKPAEQVIAESREERDAGLDGLR